MALSAFRINRGKPTQRMADMNNGVYFVIFVLLSWFSPAALGKSLHDHAKLLNAKANMESAAHLQRYLDSMLRKFDIDLQVYTTTVNSDINLLSNQLYRELNVGDLSKKKRGLLLVVNPSINKVRLEVGYALESVFTDAFIAYVEHHQMVPFFRDHQIAEGIVATVELMVTQIQTANAGMPEPDWLALSGSGGGGAAVSANIGKKSEAIPKVLTLPVTTRILEPFTENSTPEDVFELHLQFNHARLSDWRLPIYTIATREIMAGRMATVAQIDNEIRNSQECGNATAYIDSSNMFAVLRHPTHRRDCPPYFLMKEQGRWRLDILAMNQGLAMDFLNHWYLGGPIKNNPFIQPYLFAFPDWYVSSSGDLFMHRWQFKRDGADKCNKKTRILSVTNKMPAEQIGLRAGDEVIHFNGEAVRDSCHFMSLMQRVEIKREIDIEVLRAGNKITLSGMTPPHVGGAKLSGIHQSKEPAAIWMRRVSKVRPQFVFKNASSQ